MFGVMKLVVSKGQGALVDTQTWEREGGERETVIAEYFSYIAYKFVNISFFSQSDRAVTQFLSPTVNEVL